MIGTNISFTFNLSATVISLQLVWQSIAMVIIFDSLKVSIGVGLLLCAMLLVFFLRLSSIDLANIQYCCLFSSRAFIGHRHRSLGNIGAKILLAKNYV